ncbi:hypothetical protein GCM10023170_063240 [Phytohabitans houttuyneae]|uniref:Uncharacterized protein n=1 Tax=Phytohabitans houttuyneae TaxID=1076126 RepID=A0A6V8K8I7_9ACTN|nr:hypothetical protein Phou_042640 [Phytohabitans houttuyneae]
MAKPTPPPACTCKNTGRCGYCVSVINAAVAREGRPPAQRTGIAALASLSRKDAA